MCDHWVIRWKLTIVLITFSKNTKRYKKSVFRIRILWIRIQIQAVAESGSYPDHDPDPDQDFLMTIGMFFDQKSS